VTRSISRELRAGSDLGILSFYVAAPPRSGCGLL